jgi:Fe-S-cluster-containing hydrogenase component 2
MSKKMSRNSGTDIYQLLLKTSKEKKKKERAQLLQSIGVKEFFESGTIQIDMKTCRGTECELCIKACPTNALYWKTGEIGIVEELCVYCSACVLSCIVDNCIQVSRRRANGEIEKFSTPVQVSRLLHNINTGKRGKTVRLLLPDEKAYLKRYCGLEI